MPAAHMAYATEIAAALRDAADRIRTEVTVQTRSEEYGRNRAVEKLLEIAEETGARVSGDTGNT